MQGQKQRVFQVDKSVRKFMQVGKPPDCKEQTVCFDLAGAQNAKMV